MSADCRPPDTWRATLVTLPFLLGFLSSTNSTTCTSFHQCQELADCSGCLTLVQPYAAASTAAECVDFFYSLNDTQCQRNGSVVTEALNELANGTCASPSAFYVSECIKYEAECFADTLCQQCLHELFSHPKNKSSALTLPACAQSVGLLRSLAGAFCPIPRCSISKLICSQSSFCSACRARFIDGDVLGAAAQCSNSIDFNNLISNCMEGPKGCTYQRARCDENDNCRECIGFFHGNSLPPMAAGLATPACQSALTSSIEKETLGDAVFSCFSPFSSTCAKYVYSCVSLSYPYCLECLTNPLISTSSTCRDLMSTYAISSTCAPCPESVHVTNHIVIATSIVGGISLVACLAVVLTIIAYEKDRVSIADRIIVGMLLANAVYSLANAVPQNLLHTDVVNCGSFQLSFDQLRFWRAVWFGGKYALVGFEIFIVGASIWALSTGVKSLPTRFENCLHSVCVVLGVSAFTAFYVRCKQLNDKGYNEETSRQALLNTFSYLNANDDYDDYTPANSASHEYDSARAQYDLLVQAMLRAWLAFLGVAIALWLVLRWKFTRLLSEWQFTITDARAQWNRDLWAAGDMGARQTKERVLMLLKEGYEEVARPLEPFVVVFVLFGIVCIVMATDWCQADSIAHSYQSTSGNQGYHNNFITYGKCDVACEFVLSFRSLATVVVYFSQRERRAEFANLRTVWRRLGSRMFGTFRPRSQSFARVNFPTEGLENVMLIPPEEPQDSDSSSYQLMRDDTAT